MLLDIRRRLRVDFRRSDADACRDGASGSRACDSDGIQLLPGVRQLSLIVHSLHGDENC